MTNKMKIARVYLRVSTEEQCLLRQDQIIDNAKKNGYYVAGIYREKASGARSDRPELLRMIEDLQTDEILIAEKIDRISRLPLAEAEKLIKTITDKGVKLSIPGIIDLSELIAESDGIAKIVLEAMQAMLLRIALQMAREDYEDRRWRQSQGIDLAKQSGKYKGRKPDLITHEQIISFRKSGKTISETAKLARCSVPQVKKIWKQYLSEHKKG